MFWAHAQVQRDQHAGRLPVLQRPGAKCSKPPLRFRAARSFAAAWRRPAALESRRLQTLLAASIPFSVFLLQAVDQAVDKAAENKDKIVEGVKSVGVRCAGLEAAPMPCWLLAVYFKL